MKKLFFALAALCLSVSAMAQNAEEIFAKFTKNTGIEQFTASRDGRSSSALIEMSIGPNSIPIKITAKYPSMYRVELDIQGQLITTILRDSVAYVTAEGKSQKIEDPEVIQQYAPISDVVKMLVPEMDKEKATIAFINVEGKGKNAANVVEMTEKESGNKTTLYFNVETGLLDKTINEITVEGGNKMKIETTYKKYTKFDDDAILLPTIISSKAPQGTMQFEVKSFELDAPVASWMFAAPKL